MLGDLLVGGLLVKLKKYIEWYIVLELVLGLKSLILVTLRIFRVLSFGESTDTFAFKFLILESLGIPFYICAFFLNL